MYPIQVVLSYTLNFYNVYVNSVSIKLEPFFLMDDTKWHTHHHCWGLSCWEQGRATGCRGGQLRPLLPASAASPPPGPGLPSPARKGCRESASTSASWLVHWRKSPDIWCPSPGFSNYVIMKEIILAFRKYILNYLGGKRHYVSKLLSNGSKKIIGV